MSAVRPDVSIIIVSFNACADLERCLESLHNPPPAASHEIVVVDNASSDDSAATARRWSDVRVLEVGENLGFARAANTGIRASTGGCLLLLNSDTVVSAGAVDGLLDELRRQPEAAVVGPRLVDATGRVELSFGSMIGPFSELRQKLLVRGHAAGLAFVSAWVDRTTRRPHWPDWVSGACLLVRRSDAESVGLLDERYFMYAEDVDFCAAVRGCGRSIRFTPDVTVVHHGGRSRASARGATETAYRRSQLAFYQKHHPHWMPFLRLYLKLRGIG